MPCAEWLRVVDRLIDEYQLRADAARNARAVAQAVAERASWEGMTSRPTWTWVAGQAGTTTRTVARWIAWLRDLGLLGVAETGSTPTTRPMGFTWLQGNRAAVYVLAVPRDLDPDLDVDPFAGPVEENVTPTKTHSPKVSTPARAREEQDPRPLRGPGGWQKRKIPTSKRDMLAAAETCREHSLTLRRLSARHVRHLLRPWFVAGWSPADVLWALDHKPGGEGWRFTSEPRDPSGWCVFRLSAWLEGNGVPGLSREQRLASSRHQLRVEQGAWTAGRREAERASAPPPAEFRRARGVLEETIARVKAGRRRVGTP